MTEQARIVYDNVAEDSDVRGQLFDGLKFWIAQRCPMRSGFVDKVKSNGGQIVPLEKHADYLIVDHLKKHTPPGGISYKFIEQSIRNGELEDPEDYQTGPPAGTVRDVGSSMPAKNSRKPYTAEDDTQLYNWVKGHERNGGPIFGNEIYKQLEAENPRHPWQSWRDRYIKQLMNKPPSAFVSANPPPSPPSDQPIKRVSRNLPKSTKKFVSVRAREDAKMEEATSPVTMPTFTKQDWDDLYENVPAILRCDVATYLQAWEKWAAGTPQSAEQWRTYYEKKVVPQWTKDHAAKDMLETKQGEQDGNPEQAATASIGEPSTKPEGPNPTRPEVPQVETTTPPRKSGFGMPPTPNFLRGVEATEKDKAVVSDNVEPESPKSPHALLIEKLVKERQGKPPMKAYKFFVEDNKDTVTGVDSTDFTARHKVLLPRWNAMSEKGKASYIAMEQADIERYELELGLENTSKKRARDDEMPGVQQQDQALHKKKKQRQESPLLVQDDETEEDEITSARQPSPAYIEVSDDNEEGQGGEQEDDHLPKGLQTQYIAYHEDAMDNEDEEKDSFDQSISQTLPPQTPQHKSDHENPQPLASQEATLNVDFDLATPVGVWEGTVSPTSTPRARHQLEATSLDTQAILSVETQPLDLSLPEPEDRFTQSRSLSAAPPSSPPLPAESISTSHSIREIRSLERERQRRLAISPSPETYSLEEEDEEEADPDPPLDGPSISAFFTRMVSKGYAEDDITRALRMTSTRGHLASLILPTLSSGARLKEQRGVWTEQDDIDLEGGDGRGIKRVEEKHGWSGWGGCEERLEFLRMVRELEG
ncbi:hypothetical protein AOQ84DRAFT_384395 [Glonium stellatum]|uniref:DNA-binding protein RAP1 n=1 Tax=Glonium stellatum TaxID=574774 RepID=A0A8E2FDG4_9PEZI|nr:hypothetical protein AOQ84DRAFT_384395 [Glonium stellatum]